MAWPHSQDYNEAIQSPRTSLADPELRMESLYHDTAQTKLLKK